MIRSKRMLAVGLVAVLGLAAAACGGDDDDDDAGPATTAGSEATAAGTEPAGTEPAGTEPAGTEPAGTDPAGTTPAAGSATPIETPNIGLVTDTGKVDDKSFNQSAWEGAQAAAEATGGTAEFIETVNSADYANNIGQFVENGANIIITVGFGMAEATATAAAENPEIRFIGVDQFQGEPIPNVTGLVFNEDKAGFLAGALAGLLTESNTVAAVLGTDQVPPVVAFKEGYENGAKYINPDVNVIATYNPGGLDTAFNDPEWGATTARQAIDNGADVVFGAGGNTGNGALIEVAKTDGLFCIGVDTDQWETLPDAHPCLVTSAMKLINDGVVELVTAAKDGTIPSGNFFGEVGLADFHDLADAVPDDVKTQIEELTPQVISGDVPTGYTP
jgi:basic membrane protein A